MQKTFMDFKNSNFVRSKVSIIHARVHNNFEPDRFSRFDVYWIQTDKQTDKPNLYIDTSGRYSLLYSQYLFIGIFFNYKDIMNQISRQRTCMYIMYIHHDINIYELAWKPSAAQVTKSYSHRLPALELFYRETEFLLLKSIQ